MKMPEPTRLSTVTNRDGDPHHIIGYTAEQMKQYGRDLLEEAAHIAEGYPKYGDGIGEDIRKLKETL
jgi:hypothetical protein